MTTHDSRYLSLLHSSRSSLLTAAALLALVTACGEEESGTPDAGGAVVCSGHGELHGDHCHCDAGYMLSSDELSCLPASDAGSPDASFDAGVGSDSGAELDAGAPQDSGAGADAGAAALSFMPSELRGTVATSEDGSHLWLLEGVDGAALLRLELYEAYGGPTGPGHVDITAAETNYATCGTCVVYQTGCAAHGDHYHCERTFMPTLGGGVHLDALGQAVGTAMTGALEGLTLREVTIGSDYSTTEVAGGQRYQVGRWAFDVALEAAGGAAECGGHGHLDGDHCHCDTGYVLDPTNPLNCIPE